MCQHAQYNADDNAAHPGEIEAAVLAFHMDIPRQVAKRQKLAAKVDHYARNDQNDPQLDQHLSQTAEHVERLFL